MEGRAEEKIGVADEGRTDTIRVADKGRTDTIEVPDEGRTDTIEVADEGRADTIGVADEGRTDTWLKKHTVMYTAATKHPMILSIRDGTVDLDAFKRWLGQDYFFVRAFVPFLSSVQIKAWKQSDDPSDLELLLGGIVALNDEIDLLKREASKWGVELAEVVPQKVYQDYCGFLESLMGPDAEYTVAITALWVFELVYQQSFAHCIEDGNKIPAELMETCQRWGKDDFGKYCSLLEKIVNRRLRKATDEELKKAEDTFLCVLEHLVEFWNMTRG